MKSADTLASQALMKSADALALQALMKSVETARKALERVPKHNNDVTAITVTPAALLEIDTQPWENKYSAIGGLTPRQLEVLALIAEGYSNQTIAERLVLGTKSVENYINAVYQELSLTLGFSQADKRFHPRVKAALYYAEFVHYAHDVMTALRETADADSPPSPPVGTDA